MRFVLLEKNLLIVFYISSERMKRKDKLKLHEEGN